MPGSTTGKVLETVSLSVNSDNGDAQHMRIALSAFGRYHGSV